MKSIRPLLFASLLASLGLMPLAAGPRPARPVDPAPRVQPPAPTPAPAPEQTPPTPELKDKEKREQEPEENATELKKEKQEGGKGAPKEAEEKKEEKWDVNKPPGPQSEVAIDTDEGTWMSLDVSPDGKRDRLRPAGRHLHHADRRRRGAGAHLPASPGTCSRATRPTASRSPSPPTAAAATTSGSMDRDGSNPRRSPRRASACSTARPGRRTASSSSARKHFTAHALARRRRDLALPPHAAATACS